MSEIFAVAGLFLLRVGIPILMLALLGMLIDRWQTKREEEIKAQYQVKKDLQIVEKEEEEEEEVLKRAS